MNDLAVNPVPARNAAGRTRFRECESGVMKSRPREVAGLIAVSSDHLIPRHGEAER